MKKSKLLIILLSALILSACKFSDIWPEVETPVINVSLSNNYPDTVVIITWNKCVDAKGYGVTRTFTRDGVTEEQIFKYISPDETSFIDDTCEAGTEYTYTVTAGYFSAKGIFYGRVFGDLLDETSEPKTITTKKNPLVVLDHPTDIEISTVEGKTNALKLTWTPCENATRYEIYIENYKEDRKLNLEKLKTVDKSESSGCIIENLYNEYHYWFKLKALGDGGKSSVLSVFKEGVVPKALNTTMQTAIPLENGKMECYSSGTAEALWFYITPQKGVVKLDYLWGSAGVNIFSEDGKKILNESVDFIYNDDAYYGSFKENITPGSRYLLRLFNAGNIQITVE